MSFLRFYGFSSDFLEFPSVQSSKIFTAHRVQCDTNFKHKKVGFVKAGFSIFFKFMSFTAAKKLVLWISLEKKLQLK